jgi:hypothetical protein
MPSAYTAAKKDKLFSVNVTRACFPMIEDIVSKTENFLVFERPGSIFSKMIFH